MGSDRFDALTLRWWRESLTCPQFLVKAAKRLAASALLIELLGGRRRRLLAAEQHGFDHARTEERCPAFLK